MTTFLLYEIKVAIILTVFYLFYRLLLSKETLHRLNRAVLLGTVLASFVLPFCVITIHRTSNVSVMIAQMGQQSVANHSTFAAADGVGMAAYIHYFQWIAIVVFFLGMSFVLGRMMFSLFKVRQIIQTGERFLQPDGTTLIVTDRKVVPFSWMRYIVLGRQDYESNCQTILLHEQGHIAHHHSWDMLLVDIITSLQWFNPTIWMLRDDLRAIHEYEADAMVLSHGMNARQYQLLLIRKAADMGGYSIVNSISHGTLKKRINMMLHKKSSANRWQRAFYIVPVIALSLVVNAKTEWENPAVLSQMEKLNVSTNHNAVSEIGLNDTAAKAVLVTPKDTTASKSASKNIKDDFLKDALILIDGVKDESGKKLKEMNPDEIQSMNVLKGAQAKAAYPKMKEKSVILITTKQSIKDKEKIDEVLNAKEQDGNVGPKSTEDVFRHISSQIKYPVIAIEQNVQGQWYASFDIDAEGRVSNMSVSETAPQVKGAFMDNVYVVGYQAKGATTQVNRDEAAKARESIKKEVARVVENMPNWKPAQRNGQPIASKQILSFSFKLQ